MRLRFPIFVTSVPPLGEEGDMVPNLVGIISGCAGIVLMRRPEGGPKPSTHKPPIEAISSVGRGSFLDGPFLMIHQDASYQSSSLDGPCHPG